ILVLNLLTKKTETSKIEAATETLKKIETATETLKWPAASDGLQPRSKSNPLVDIFKVHGLTHRIFVFGDKAKGKGKEFPGGEITDAEVDNVCEFGHFACAYTFELQPKKGIPWVRLDEIRVVVNNYQPLPRGPYHYLIPLSSEWYHTYYVEIDKPETAGE